MKNDYTRTAAAKSLPLPKLTEEQAKAAEEAWKEFRLSVKREREMKMSTEKV